MPAHNSLHHVHAYHLRQHILKNRLTVFSLVVSIFTCVISLLGYLIMPDNTPYASEAAIQIRKQPPIFKVKILKFRKNADIEEVDFLEKFFFGENSRYTIVPVVGQVNVRNDSIYFTPYPGREKKVLVESLLNCVAPLYVGASSKLGESVRANYIVSADSITYIDVTEKIVRVSKKSLEESFALENIEDRVYWLGTDRSGRDILSRLIYSTKVSLLVAIISVIITLLIGTTMGAIAGLVGSRADRLISWLIEVFFAVPAPILTIIILLGFEHHDAWHIGLSVGLSTWVEVALVVRREIITVKQKPYIQTVKILGFSQNRIIFKHIFPNINYALIVVAVSNLSTAIIIEAGISFLGLGVDSIIPSWGIMLKEGFESLGTRGSWHLVLLPGLSLSIMILAFQLFAKGLEDARTGSPAALNKRK